VFGLNSFMAACDPPPIKPTIDFIITVRMLTSAKRWWAAVELSID
jgi:hypothetical protein